MKRIVSVTIAVLVLLPAAAHAQRRWSKLDTGLLVVSSQLLTIDWLQTVDISRTIVHCPAQYAASGGCRPASWHRRTEGNPFLGPHPSVGKVNTYFSLAVGLNMLAHRLPPTPRRVLWTGVTIVQTWVVIRNHRAGVRLNLQF